jgi:ABC-type Fe3+-hydroxamate transport system substrate-binding protein
MVSKANGDSTIAAPVKKILDGEIEKQLDTLIPYRAFAERVSQTKQDLLRFIANVHAEGKTVAALGASTKGNVLLQYCGLTEKEVEFVGEVNAEKFGCYTPGTWIPIIPEEELLAKKPDYLIVLPWHFKRFFEGNSKFADMHLVLPLPQVEVM